MYHELYAFWYDDVSPIKQDCAAGFGAKYIVKSLICKHGPIFFKYSKNSRYVLIFSVAFMVFKHFYLFFTL
jgi:hypothetical protein